MTDSGRPEPPIIFRYHFTLADRRRKSFAVHLDPATLQIIQPARADFPNWTALGYAKCPNCPLSETEHARCPAAASMIELVDFFNQSLSIEEVDVEVEAKERRYAKHCSLQEGLSSLVGIYMACSGCPIMAKLRPMARFHLPFSNTDESRYRILSMYLLAQYYRARQGATPDWQFKDLATLYREIATVNMHFFKRLHDTVTEDASLNALIRLQALADTIEFSIDQDFLGEMAWLFEAYLTKPA